MKSRHTFTPTPAEQSSLLRCRVAYLKGMARERFRGGCLENLGGAPMGKGHGNRGRPFDVSTARYLKPLFDCYDWHVLRMKPLKLVIKAGVKTLKSYTGEVMAADHVCNRNGDFCIYFGSAEVSDSVSTTRILDHYDGIPNYAAKKLTLYDRFQETTSEMKFPDKTLFIKPANLAQTQQKNLGGLMVQDAFVTGATGMIDQAIQRTTQYAKERIIILESQGGEGGDGEDPETTGFDFDRHYADTDQRELHVCCQACRTNQIWNWRAWERTRADGFAAVPPTSIPEGDRAEWVAVNTKLLLSPARRKTGFKYPDEGTDTEIKAGTTFECYHCGTRWQDDGEFGPTRIALDESSHYMASRSSALAENIGFNFPQWINRRLAWGDIALAFVKTKRGYDLGLIEPYKQWWQKVAARTWVDSIGKGQSMSIITGTYDPNAKLIPHESFRCLLVDPQKDYDLSAKLGREVTGWAWWIAEAVDKSGGTYMLGKGHITNWEQLFGKGGIKEKLGIPTRNVAIDGGHFIDTVRELAGKYHTLEDKDAAGRPCAAGTRLVATWMILMGDDARGWKWKEDNKWRVYSEPRPDYVDIMQPSGKWLRVNLAVYRWSNFSVTTQLQMLRMGMPGKPKFIVLDDSYLDAHTRKFAVGNCTYQNQMDGQVLGERKNKPTYLNIHPDQHWPDCHKMGIVLKAMRGVLGHIAAPDVDGQESK